MPFKQDESFKALIESIGKMMDARFETFRINFRAEIQDDLKKLEARLRNDMATKDDIKGMVVKDDIKDMVTKDDIKDMATKDDIQRLEKKLDKIQKGNDARFEVIEEELHIVPTSKN